MVTEIKLTLNKMALVDDDIADEISRYKWQAYKDASSGNERYYATRHVRINGKMKTFRMHRYIYELKTGGKLSSSQHIDHINNNGLDNRIKNLRLATVSQNAANKIVSNIKKSSKYKGVYWNKGKEKWQAQIEYNYKKYNLGYFNREEEVEAAELYDINALIIFKEFANINFPNAEYVKGIKKSAVEYSVVAATA